MSKKQAYCGIKPVKKNQRIGSMKECADKKQIKYWGIKKADAKMVEYAKKGSKGRETLNSVKLKIVKLRGKQSRLKKLMSGEKNKTEKDKLQKELDKIHDDLDAAAVKYKQIEKGQARQTSRRRSKRSKKGSRRSRRSRRSRSKRSRKGSRRSRKGSRN